MNKILEELKEILEKHSDKIGSCFDENYNADLDDCCSDILTIIWELEKIVEEIQYC